MVAARSFIPAIFVLDAMSFDNGNLYSRLPSEVNPAVLLLFADIQVLVVLPMVIDDYFNCYVRACILDS
jgi:hypothetical protein